MDLSTWPLSTLQSLANTKAEEYMKLVNAATPDTAKITNAKKIMEQFFAEIKKRENVPTVKLEASGATSSTLNTDMRTLETTFKESVSVFKTGQSVNTFVNQLDNCYLNNQVAATGLEVNFVRMLGSKLSDDYKTNLLQLNENERDSWAKIKAYLLKTYETQETIYQTMAKVWNIQREPGEDIHSLGIRMEEKTTEVYRQIEAKMKSLSSDKSFTAKDAFMLMGSMLMVQHVQRKEPEAYKHMVNEIDTAVKPSEISLKAKSYIDKIGESEPAAINHGTFSTKKEDKKQLDCNSWKSTGSCKFGKRCHYRHLECYKKGSPEAKPQPPVSNEDQKVNDPQAKTQAAKEEKVAGRKPEQNNYPGPYFAYPPHYPPPYYPPFYNFNNQSHHVGNQNGQSYIVGNNRELFEDPEYECVGQEVFGRDIEESGYENCGQEVFEDRNQHFWEIQDFRQN